MKRQNKITVFLTAAISALSMVASGDCMPAVRPSPQSMVGKPNLMIWAWERPENLKFICPDKVGVSFLALTMHAGVDQVAIKPRLQTLDVPKSTYLEGVVHLETDASATAHLTATQILTIASAIEETVRRLELRAVQIDFDAKVSERESYGMLLREVRKRLGAGVTVSMTALVSWCLYDYWLADLPVDEVVPMLFSMGADENKVLLLLKQGRRFSADKVEHALGVSVDGPFLKLAGHCSTVNRLLQNRRIYIFSATTWSPNIFHRAMAQIHIKQNSPTAFIKGLS